MKGLHEAGADLSHVRAQVCKALRAGEGRTVIHALLEAEARAAQELREVIEAERLGVWWDVVGVMPSGTVVSIRANY